MTHEELKAARLHLGATQTQMASFLATDQKSYQRWEADPSQPYSRAVPPLVARVVNWLLHLDGFAPPEWLSSEAKDPRQSQSATASDRIAS